MRIGELAQRLGVTTKAIRYYESIGLLPPSPRTGSGYRSFAEPDVERLTFVKTAQRLGLSLDEIAEIMALRDRGEHPCGYVMEVLDRQVAELDQRIREMRSLRDELRALRSRAADAGFDGCAGRYCGLLEHTSTR